MDYTKHYEALIERARNRILEGYSENHHIIPRCLGGTDDKDNLVRLTPEEHYVAHQLLVKMHPHEKGLIWAAHRMTSHSNTGERSRNKLYGWLKKRNQKIAKQRLGEKNGSHGRSWFHHPETQKAIKCLPDDVPEGYIKGRTSRKCVVCENIITGSIRKTCSKECASSVKGLSMAGKQPQNKIKISEEVIKEIVERNDNGESLLSIYSEYGLNKWTIYDIVRRHKHEE